MGIGFAIAVRAKQIKWDLKRHKKLSDRDSIICKLISKDIY